MLGQARLMIRITTLRDIGKATALAMRAARQTTGKIACGAKNTTSEDEETVNGHAC